MTRMKKTEEKNVLLFVDTIEAGIARLLLDRAAFEAPAALLPEGAAPGSWVRVTLGLATAPPSHAEAILEELGRKDPGGDIKL